MLQTAQMPPTFTAERIHQDFVGHFTACVPQTTVSGVVICLEVFFFHPLPTGESRMSRRFEMQWVNTLTDVIARKGAAAGRIPSGVIILVSKDVSIFTGCDAISTGGSPALRAYLERSFLGRRPDK